MIILGWVSLGLLAIYIVSMPFGVGKEGTKGCAAFSILQLLIVASYVLISLIV